MRFLAYIIGFLILIAGLAWAAIEAGAPVLYVQIAAVMHCSGSAYHRRESHPHDSVNAGCGPSVRDDIH
jgi:hypothetical protein